jgi:curved DNA-binding protein CbpA
MNSLYDDLNVAPDASFEEIKRAHRKAARRHHPDAGGNREDFEKIQHAYMILANPTKREKYDRTGTTDETIDNSLAKLAANIMQAFDLAMTQVSDYNLPYTDMISQTKFLLNQRQREIGAQQESVGIQIAKIKKIAKRIKFTGSGNNIIHNTLQQRIVQGEAAINQLREQKIDIVAAISYLDNYGFEFEKREQSIPMFREKFIGTWKI